jgi:hypothetical protein
LNIFLYSLNQYNYFLVDAFIASLTKLKLSFALLAACGLAGGAPPKNENPLEAIKKGGGGGSS